MPRKEREFHFIYKTTNLLSGKYYIGMHSTDNLEDGYLGSGTRLRYSINKHGAENHVREILELVDSREELKKREKEIVNLNEIAKEECMNLTVGGEGGFSPETHSKGGMARFEQIKNDPDLYKEHIKSFKAYNKKAREDGKLVCISKSYCWGGKNHSEETKKKISEAKKDEGIGKFNSQYGTCWITNGEVNKKIKKEELEIFTKEGWYKGRV